MDGNKLMNKLIGETLVRHYGMSSEEFTKSIGFEGETEEKAVYTSMFNVLTEICKESIKAKSTIDRINKTLEMWFKEEEDGN